MNRTRTEQEQNKNRTRTEQEQIMTLMKYLKFLIIFLNNRN